MPESEPMEFIPLHFGDKLRVVNPRARLGILTLWSRIDFVEGKLREMGVDLDPKTSTIAVIGNLYGNGIPHLLRNLLYNPQIRDLVPCGANRSASLQELMAFFNLGLAQTTNLGEPVTRIVGTNRFIDDLVQPDMFAGKPEIHRWADPQDKGSLQALCSFIRSFSPEDEVVGERIEVPLPEVKISHYPSEPRNCSIVAETPLAGWRELVFRLHRFGHLVHLRKGDRQELQNVRVVITHPQEDDAKELREFGVLRADLHRYQRDMLLGPLPEDHSYTYGNRIREYYGFDALDKFAERLAANPQDRDCYLALWDSHSDIDADDAPCLVSLFFRVFDERLTLTACYRTHNALDAWLKNVYGLMKAQEIVSEQSGIPVGPLTVISHSISIDPSKYDLAERVAKSKGFSVDIDPNGQFMLTADHEAGEIVVQHLSNEGFLLHEYRSAKAERIQHELARDCAISDINHALYVGRQLAKAENCLKAGEPFEEG
jgi:thymidylate synthase